jgi:superfamily II DNA or RNA helicase
MKDVISVTYEQTGTSQTYDEMGMRAMQARVYGKRDEQYILLKAPPASGKSRALMFLGLHKLARQELRKVIVAVPEKSIGNSFRSTELKKHGFFADWEVKPQWNLCTDETVPDQGAILRSKVKQVGQFLKGDDQILVCTHATLRFSFDEFPLEMFDGCLIAVDEFHHASAHEENRLGEVVRDLISRGQTHIIAMTGSYFRGDTVLVLRPEDEAKFVSVSYTYYEQLNGYKHLKSLGIGYHFYSGVYTESIGQVLDPFKKTIIHIPHVGSSASTGNKYGEVYRIFDAIGDYQRQDPKTGLHLIKRADGAVLKVADLVEDTPEARLKVQSTLRHLEDKDAVDIIIALGMAKEGFDWIWCEHALTVGYRSSLTEIIQIIGRATRDAPDKTHAQFTNLIPEPEATEGVVTSAVNDLLKAISASLLMQQVLAPKFKFVAKKSAEEGGDEQEAMTVNDQTGEIQIAVKGLKEPTTDRVKQIVEEDINELIHDICTDNDVSLHAATNHDLSPETLNRVLVPKVIERRYEDLEPEQVEELRQQVVARMNLMDAAQRMGGQDRLSLDDQGDVKIGSEGGTGVGEEGRKTAAEAGLLKMVRSFINVRDLDIDLIDHINPFQTAYEILSKDLDTKTLAQIQSAIIGKTVAVTEEEAIKAWPRIVRFKEDNGRWPSTLAANEIERRFGEIYAWLMTKKRQAKAAAQSHS